MIVTHNYYVDLLKSFNLFLKKIFNKDQFKYGRPIQKIEYNIGSKTLLTHNLYNNEQFEYPNMTVDLQDVRVAEGVSSIAHNVYGLMPTVSTTYLADNLSKNQYLNLETKKYIVNFNININLENAADMLNYYHQVSNNVPLEFTFVDYSFFYTVEITDFVKNGNWDFDKDDIFNVVIKPDPTERDKDQYFAYFLTQPEIEITGLNKTEDKENNKYTLTFNCLISTYFPIILYGSNFTNIDRIIYSIDASSFVKDEYPIFSDTKEIFKNNKLKKGEVLNINNFLIIPKTEDEDKNETTVDIYLNSNPENSDDLIFILKIDDQQLQNMASFELFIDKFKLIKEDEITKIRIIGDQAKLLLPYIQKENDNGFSYLYQIFYVNKSK
jgi:hypothetical protein